MQKMIRISWEKQQNFDLMEKTAPPLLMLT